MERNNMAVEKEQLVFIVNPKSAAGATLRRFERFRDLYGASLGPFDVRLTEKPGDATILARAALEKAKQSNMPCTVVSVGGDGTMNEIVNGFFSSTQESVWDEGQLAIFPSGTGGDFARTFGWGREPEASLNRIRHGTQQSVDVGKVRFVDHNGADAVRYFLNIGSFGLTGAVDEVVNRSSKTLGAKFSFIAGTVRAFAAYESPTVRLRIDEENPHEQEISLVAVANGQYFGGGMWIAPPANVQDGSFHIVTVRGAKKRFWLKNALKVYSGTHLSLNEIQIQTGKSLVAEPVRSTDRVLLDLDGEQPGILPAHFEILPGALRLLV
jgi:YegS/Rv2252/BmrU family lipid kinase